MISPCFPGCEADVRDLERQRKSAPDDTFALAARGLVNMGFRKKEADVALTLVREQHSNDNTAPAVASVLREALAVLT